MPKRVSDHRNLAAFGTYKRFRSQPHPLSVHPNSSTRPSLHRNQRNISASSPPEPEEKLNLYLCDVIEDVKSSGLPPYLRQDFLARPARLQATKSVPAAYYNESDPRYNFWYHTYRRNHSDPEPVEPSSSRVYLQKDSGFTKAKPNVALCIWFARGACTKGEDCLFLHRVPTADDDLKLDINKDVFGRQRFADQRSDLSGAGPTQHAGRTLFVTGLVLDADVTDAVDKLEAQLFRNFYVFGPLELITILPRRPAAVVRFQYRSAAEFAKVAMFGQPVGKSRAVAVSWAAEEPLTSVEARRREFYIQVGDALIGQ